MVRTGIADLQWGRNMFVAECRKIPLSYPDHPDPFNGAATCSLRNDLREFEMRARFATLQWGRNMFVAE